MNWMDLEQERRRVGRYDDLTKTAFTMGLIAASIVVAIAFYALWPTWLK